MTDRIINLSEREQAAVVLQLGGREFRISRVVNGVRLVYGAFLKEAGAFMGKVSEVQELEDKLADSSEQGQKAMLAEIEKTVAQVEDFSRRKVDVLMRCLELLLVNNGYAFEREWWVNNGDEGDYQAFIVAALTKDNTTQKKTAEEGGSTGGASLSTSAAGGAG